MSENQCWLALLALLAVIGLRKALKVRRRWDAHERALWDQYRGVV